MRIRTTITFLIILISFNSCAQNGKKTDDLEVLEKYINIPNSRLSFPSSSFKKTDNLIGLIKGNQAVIQIMEATDDNFLNQAKNFKEETFTEKGGIIIANKNLEIENYQAKYMSLKTPQAQKLTLLLFGDSTFCVMIYAVNNNIYDKKTNKEIEYLLKNIKYDKDKKLNPIELAPFYFEENNTGFKHANYSTNIHYFTKTGDFNKGEDNMPFVIVSSGPIASENDFEQMFDFSIQMVKKYGGEILQPIKKEKTRVNGYNGYEDIIDLKQNGEKQKLYLLLLHSNDIFIQIQGKAKSKNDILNIQEFAHHIIIKE